MLFLLTLDVSSCVWFLSTTSQTLGNVTLRVCLDISVCEFYLEISLALIESRVPHQEQNSCPRPRIFSILKSSADESETVKDSKYLLNGFLTRLGSASSTSLFFFFWFGFAVAFGDINPFYAKQIYLHFWHTQRHRCAQAPDRTKFYSRPDRILWSRNWFNTDKHTK